MRIAISLLSLLAAVTLCSSASAMCMGGGMAGGGGVSRGGGGISASWTGSGNRGTKNSNDSVGTKADLPAAATLVALDTKAWDNAYAQLNLTSEQQQKVDALLADLKATADKLAKDQKEARAAYDKASTQTVIYETARKVMDAADAIKGFNPNTKFDLALASILTADQKTKFRELKMKS
jgi:hypothetical protein